MNKRVGFLGLMVAAAAAFFSPAVASAQDRYDCRPGYVARDYRGDFRDSYRDREWHSRGPVFRERPEWRDRVYVEPRRYEPVYRDGFRHHEPRPGLGWYGR